MEDITNTSHSIGDRWPARGLFLHEPALEPSVKHDRYSPTSQDNQLQVSGQQDPIFATWADNGVSGTQGVRISDAAAQLFCGTAPQQVQRVELNSTQSRAQGNLLRVQAESEDTHSVSNSIVLQDAAVRLNSVTRSLEEEGARIQSTADLFQMLEKKFGHLEQALRDLQQERDLLADENNRLRAHAKQRPPSGPPQMTAGPRLVADCRVSSAQLMQRVQALCAESAGTRQSCRQEEGSEDGADCGTELPHQAQFYRAVAKTFAKQVLSFDSDFGTADQAMLIEDLKRFKFWANNQVKPFLQQEEEE